MKKYIVKRICSTTLVLLASAFLLVPVFAQAETITDENNTAIGTVATLASGSNNNEITGVGAQAGNGDRNTAVGVGAVVEGSNNQITGYGATAAGGNDNTAVGVGVVVSGNDNKVVGYGAQAVNGSYNTALGSSSGAGNGNNNTALGYGAQAGNSDFNTAVGSRTSAIGYASTSLGYGAQASGEGSIALGAGSVANEAGTVSVGRSDYQRRITNVAAGVYDTDAVNVSQLRSAIGSTDNKIDRVGSMAFAMSALAPMAYDPKDPTQYAAGMGTYNGKTALAVGVYHYSKPDVLLNAAVAFSSDGWEKSARFGVTWKTGGPKAKQLVPATTQEKPTISQENLDLRIKRIMDSYDAGTITDN